MASWTPGMDVTTDHGSSGGRSGTASPGTAPVPPSPDGPSTGTELAADGPAYEPELLGSEFKPGAITDEAAGTACSESGGGGVGGLAAAAGCAVATPGWATCGAGSGINTEASRSHSWPDAHVPELGIGALTVLTGVIPSVAPSVAATAAPRTAILMEGPSRGRLAIGRQALSLVSTPPRCRRYRGLPKTNRL